MIRSRIIEDDKALPLPGTYKDYSAWDFADSTGRNSDYSVGVVGRLNNFGQLFIMNIIRGKFGPSELAYQVAQQAAKWRVEKIYIEKSPGADFLQNDILRELQRQNYAECPYPEFFPVDNQKGAKEKRAEQLESYFHNRLLWLYGRGIIDSDPNMVSTLIEEFIRFKPGTKRKDDIIDAIAHCCRVIPAKVDLPKDEMQKTQIVWEILKEKQLQDMYFGVRENATPQPMQDLPLNHFDGMPVVCSHCGCSPCLGT
jgi:predicted phage terminase large subunit-like protein